MQAIPVWAAVALFVGAVVFLLSQALVVGYAITCPLYSVLFSCASCPQGCGCRVVRR